MKGLHLISFAPLFRIADGFPVFTRDGAATRQQFTSQQTMHTMNVFKTSDFLCIFIATPYSILFRINQSAFVLDSLRLQMILNGVSFYVKSKCNITEE